MSILNSVLLTEQNLSRQDYELVRPLVASGRLAVSQLKQFIRYV